jgi:hypothetical protein
MKEHIHLHALDAAIGRAAAAFGLDPQQPAHRELLLGILADVLFPETKHSSRHALLYARAWQLYWNGTPAAPRSHRGRKPRGFPDRLNLAKQLKVAFPDDYGNIADETLAKYLSSWPIAFRKE